jgi:hypothetical protein
VLTPLRHWFNCGILRILAVDGPGSAEPERSGMHMFAPAYDQPSPLPTEKFTCNKNRLASIT